MHQTQWGPERPLPPPVSLASQSHHEKPPEVTCTSRGNPGLPASTRERPRETFFNTSRGHGTRFLVLGEWSAINHRLENRELAVYWRQEGAQHRHIFPAGNLRMLILWVRNRGKHYCYLLHLKRQTAHPYRVLREMTGKKIQDVVPLATSCSLK